MTFSQFIIHHFQSESEKNFLKLYCFDFAVHFSELIISNYRFDFASDARVCDAINKAKKKFSERASKVRIDAFKFDKFGKNACKVANVGPDSVMQLAFQIAYHRLTGKFVPTYESCSTVKYY